MVKNFINMTGVCLVVMINWGSKMKKKQMIEEPFEEFGGGKTDGNGEGNSEKSDDFFD